MSESMTLEQAKAKLREVEMRLDSVASSCSGDFAAEMLSQLREYRMALAVIDGHLQNGGTAGDEVARDAVSALPALWRQREPDNGEEETEFDKGYQQASDECAEMLEAAIAQSHPIEQAIAGKGEL